MSNSKFGSTTKSNPQGWPIADMAAGSPYVYNAIVIGITDGDTIKVKVDHGMNIFSVQTLRLNRINAPERNTEEGEVAKNQLTYLLNNEQVMIHTMKDRKEKYGRWIAEVFHESVNISDFMVKEGMAKYQQY